MSTHFGLVPMRLPDEEWPTVAGKPMLFVCQLNLKQAPSLPPLLNDLALITFFVDPNHGRLAHENGHDWELRAYTSLDGLIPLPRPQSAPALKRGFECRWEQEDDDEDVAFTKLGIYPSTIQDEPWWEHENHPAKPEFCIQINSEEKVGLFWGDAGMVYLARGASGEWFLDWQCY